MIKKLFLVTLVLAFATWAWASNAAKNDADRSVQSSKKIDKNLVGKIETARQPIVIYGTDFETEGEWEVQQLGGGNVFSWVTDNSHSPTHSWWVADDAPMTEAEALPTNTAIVSPVIDLPADIDGYAPKVLQAQYWVDVETPNTADGGSVYDVFQADIELPYDGDNFWHTDTYQGLDGGSSWWCGDPDLGTYGSNWRQVLITPTLDLSGAAGPVMLKFKNAPNSEPGYDYCHVDVSSDDGATWTEIDAWDEENDPLVWYDEEYDISAMASATTVVRWRFDSDGGYESPNSWHIDNIEITDGTTQFLFDDGGDTATQLIPVEHPLAWIRMHYEYDDGRLGDTWILIDDAQVSWNGSLDLIPYAGVSTRLRVRVSTDGWNRLGEAPGYGFYVDDFEVFGQGVAAYDGAFAGVTGLFDAAPGKPLNAKVFIANEGLNPISNVIWAGEIKNALGEKVGSATGRWTDPIDPGQVVAIETLEPVRWVPLMPGEYTLELLQIVIPNDGYNPNDMPEDPVFPFIVHGPPYTELLYAEDFMGVAGASALEDFGWTAVNGGTSADTWIWDSGWGGFGQGPTLSGYYNIVDTDSTMDEHVMTPPVDITGIGKHNQLALGFFLRYQPGHPVLDDYFPGLFGFWDSQFEVLASIDGGESWEQVAVWVDDDTLGGTGFMMREPVVVDLSPLLLDPDVESVQFDFHFTSENGYVFVVGFSNVMVYAPVSKPAILAVNDVPEDQGKAVQLAWRGSFNDQIIGDEEVIPVTRYDVWRHDPLEDAMVWTYVGAVPASDHKVYGLVVPTLMDEVETEYVIEAKTAMPGVWSMAEPMAGMSMDNLAPAAPQGLAAYGQDNQNVLVWEEAYTPVNDVKYYSVYRTEASGSYPAEPVATTIDLTYTDTDVTVDTKYYYVVTATDFAGNESEYSSETEWVTGVVASGTKGVPKDYAMYQNYPNPFNPTTTVEFALPKASDVTLKVYNVAGQEIETLVDENVKAGYHKVTWDATNVSGGLYIVEMKAGSFVKTMKMVLTK